MDKYLTMPIQAGLLIQKQEHPTCDLKLSIAQKLHLITTTHYDECKFDASFGCPIWDNDFETIPSVNMWRDKTSKLVEEVVRIHEPRLSNVTVTLGMMQEEISDSQNKLLKQIKKRIELKISGTIEKTSEQFDFNTYFYFSPISFD